jgi:hypothetical protein
VTHGKVGTRVSLRIQSWGFSLRAFDRRLQLRVKLPWFYHIGKSVPDPNGANGGGQDGLTKRVFRLAPYQGKFREGKRAGPMFDSRRFLHFFCRFGSISAFQNTC